MHDTMYKLKDIVLCDIEEIVGRGAIQPNEYEVLGEAVDILKDLKTIEAMDEYGESPEVSGYMPRRYNSGAYYPQNSYNNSYGYSGGGNSYERGRSQRTGRYVSRDDKSSMGEKLDRMMAEAKTDMERDVIRRMIDALMS